MLQHVSANFSKIKECRLISNARKKKQHGEYSWPGLVFYGKTV